MAISSFTGLQTSLRALLAQQAALDVTSHNISNANTVGYTRQQAVFAATTPLEIDAGIMQSGAGAQLGQGVDIQSFQRMRDQFTDLQYRAQNMSLGDQSTTAAALDQAQSLLGEPGDTGINALFGKFYDSWSTLASNPTSSAAKTAVIGAAQNLVGAIKQLQSGLTGIQTVAGQQLTSLTSATGPVQTAAAQIARLNQSIKDATTSGQQPNDLLDQRDQLIDQLSAYGQVSLTDLGNGSLNLSMDGQQVVADTTFTWPATYTATSGQLGALTKLSGSSSPIAGYLSQLDAIANGLATSVNGASSGFFSGTTAATLAVNATAATLQAGTGGAGASDIALAVAALRGGPTDAAGTYAALVQQMGADTADVQRQQTATQALVDSADSRRQQVSGVSLDEEMTNLVRFQRGYQAASRAFSTMDEMLDVLINRTGKVGL